MMKRLVTVLCALGAAGCLDFEARYAETVARLADGGDDGGFDAGPAPGTDAGADAGTDAGLGSGCDASLCLLGTWQVDTTQIDYWAGLAASDEAAAVALGVHRDNAASSNQRYETWFARPSADGGFALTKSTLSRLRPNRTDVVVGRAGDLWFTDYDGVFHVDGTAELDVTPVGCLQPGQDTGWTGLRWLNADEALIAGGGGVVCRTNWRTGQTTTLLNLNLGYRPWYLGVYPAPDGGLFIADEYAQVLAADGGALTGALVADPNNEGIAAMDGTGGLVFVLTTEGGVYSNASGPFAPVFDAGIIGRELRVFAANDVWVGGGGPTMFHFDGASWQPVRVPNVGTYGYVKSIGGGRRYLHLAACAGYDSNFNCATSLLLSYRRGP